MTTRTVTQTPEGFEVITLVRETENNRMKVVYGTEKTVKHYNRANIIASVKETCGSITMYGYGYMKSDLIGKAFMKTTLEAAKAAYQWNIIGKGIEHVAGL